jgi:hypothetical protein
VWTTKSGFVPLNLLVDSLDTFKVTRWDIVNPHVTWVDDNAAIVLYKWAGVGTFGEQPLTPTALASDGVDQAWWQVARAASSGDRSDEELTVPAPKGGSAYRIRMQRVAAK